jgi:hypothetical protein
VDTDWLRCVRSSLRRRGRHWWSERLAKLGITVKRQSPSTSPHTEALWVVGVLRPPLLTRTAAVASAVLAVQLRCAHALRTRSCRCRRRRCRGRLRSAARARPAAHASRGEPRPDRWPCSMSSAWLPTASGHPPRPELVRSFILRAKLTLTAPPSARATKDELPAIAGLLVGDSLGMGDRV